MAIGHRIGLAIAAIGGACLLASAPAAAQNYSDGYRFLKAVDKKDQAEVERLINKSSILLDSRDLADGHTALHTVVERRDSQWMRYLLTEGENPNIADKNGITPLARAAQLGWVEGVAILASKGAKADVTNDTGETPLIAAVHKRDLAMVRILLTAGADPDHSDNTGRTARDYAKAEGASGSGLLDAIAENDKHPRTKSAGGQTYGPTL